jgi:hypothetical protein
MGPDGTLGDSSDAPAIAVAAPNVGESSVVVGGLPTLMTCTSNCGYGCGLPLRRTDCWM